MTNIFGTPVKAQVKERLFEVGIEVLQQQGWKVEKIPGFGKSSVRLITKNGESRKVSIRTTQDQWIAFPRNVPNGGWVTLSDVDAVLPVSVDNVENPKVALVHMIEADE